ncbi:MAG TPA: hypothetical protein VGF17_29380 [Phytomonospora sp.]
MRILGRRPRAPAGNCVRAAAEREVMEAGIPWTVLRAALFVEALRGVPGKAGRAYRAGENLNFDAERGAGSWADPASA